MSKNHQSWEQPERDVIKDLENCKDFILKQALAPRRPFPMGSKTYEFLQANCPDFLKHYKVITVPEPEPD
jgi:hypothetical protein